MQRSKIKRKSFTIRLNPDIFYKFKERALQENLPISNAIEIVLQESLQRGYIIRREVKG